MELTVEYVNKAIDRLIILLQISPIGNKDDYAKAIYLELKDKVTKDEFNTICIALKDRKWFNFPSIFNWNEELNVILAKKRDQRMQEKIKTEKYNTSDVSMGYHGETMQILTDLIKKYRIA